VSAGISRDAWLAALGDAAMPLDPHALTVVEIAQQFGIGHQAAYSRVRKLVAEKRAVVTAKIITTSQGVPRRVPAYRLVSDAPRPATRKR
jgi:hypothetical protein